MTLTDILIPMILPIEREIKRRNTLYQSSTGAKLTIKQIKELHNISKTKFYNHLHKNKPIDGVIYK